jgi:spore coat protein A
LRNLGLPDFIENGGREIPLVFQEKVFWGADTVDPTWPGECPSSPGSLWYPHEYNLMDLGGNPDPSPLPALSLVPEFFGDTMLVNGVVNPFVEVEPRVYRLRILNATQASFLNLQLYEDDGNGNPDFSTKGPDFLVLGTEGGFLAFPALVPSNQPLNFTDLDHLNVNVDNPGGSLLTAPAERWDVLINFRGYEGKYLLMTNDAPAPFPSGDAGNVFTNTSSLMQFRVANGVHGKADAPLKITTRTPLALNPQSGIYSFPIPLDVFTDQGRLNMPHGIKVRHLTLNEIFDEYGRLIQMLGTNQTVPLPPGFWMDPTTPDYPNNYARSYMDPATETPQAGDVEIWQIANLTGDVHPMHFHLVNVLVLSRQSFTDPVTGNFLYSNGVPTFTAPPVSPPPTERGWKETVKMYPGQVTTVIMQFNLPSVPFQVPNSPRTGGKEYVWHCHILEHEEHDMMRPLIIT